jgi:hypothetical protein
MIACDVRYVLRERGSSQYLSRPEKKGSIEASLYTKCRRARKEFERQRIAALIRSSGHTVSFLSFPA